MNVTKSSPVYVGIAGLGRSGWDIHVNAIRTMPDHFTVVAVSDADKSRSKNAADELNCRAYNDINELLTDDKAELIVVATPNHLHSEHAIATMKAGKDVVCEKPVATNLADLEKMIAISQETGRKLAPFQNRRYSPDFMKVREVIESGKLGRIVMIRIANHAFLRRWDWQALKAWGGGIINNLGPHLIDQALQLLGQGKPEVLWHMERILSVGDAEDHCKIILRAPNAPMIDIEMSCACAYPQDNWLVMGTQGGLKGNMFELQWKYVDFNGVPKRSVKTASASDRSYESEELLWQEESWKMPKEDWQGMTVNFYKELYPTLRHGAPLPITAESIRRQIEIIDKCNNGVNSSQV